MSTAAEPRRPSPANMPARRPSASAADQDLIVPAVGRSNYRDLYTDGIDRSNLLAHHKLVAFALAIHASQDGTIQPHDQPRLLGLIHDTGLHVGQVCIALTVLRQRGWIRQVNRRDRFEVADFVLTIPKPLMARLLRQRAAAQQSQPTV
ncbi:hypothetical protein [Streptomyces sp. NPDC048332]|uniref:hypothetical protein n=1 Tax=Streptomyces sp. NPDC048332 TaxID=3154619 RepID=UPI003418683E